MANFNYTLGVIVRDVTRIEHTIQRIEQAMRHASPATVDVLRRNKTQLERLLDFIMEQDVTSHLSLPSLLTAHKECLQDCINNIYNSKKNYMGRTRK
jgi:hypothetical protein